MYRMVTVAVIALSLLITVACGGDSSNTQQPQDTSFGQPTLKSDSKELEFPILLMPKWEAGDVRSLMLSSERLRSGEDDISLSIPVTLTVLEQNADGYVLEWRYGEIQVKDKSIMFDPAAAAIFGLLNGMRLEYEVDEFGIFERLRNLEELESQIETVVDLMFEMLEDAGLDETQIASIRHILEPVITGETALSQQLEHIHLYLAPLGYEFYEGESITYDDLLPMPFGDSLIPSKVEWWIDSYDVETDTAVVKWTQSIDPEITGDVILDKLRDSARAMETDEPTADEMPSPYEIKDIGEYTVDVGKSWILSMEYERKVISGPEVRIDRTELIDVTTPNYKSSNEDNKNDGLPPTGEPIEPPEQRITPDSGNDAIVDLEPPTTRTPTATSDLCDNIVTFPDAALETAVRNRITKLSGNIFQSDISSITSLDARGMGINSIDGIEHCINLEILYLGPSKYTSESYQPAPGEVYRNYIVDISPLSSLTHLRRLSLNCNEITDISPLVKLTSLRSFHIENNEIEDIKPLANISNLQELNLAINGITDLSPLSTLTELKTLLVSSNNISDCSPISNLTNLNALNLMNNQITDISPLLENSGLNDGDSISLTGNPLSEDSIDIYIPLLEERGVKAVYRGPTHWYLYD